MRAVRAGGVTGPPSGTLNRLASASGMLGPESFGFPRPLVVGLTRTAKLFYRLAATSPVPFTRFTLAAYRSGIIPTKFRARSKIDA